MKAARKDFGATNNTPWLAEITPRYPDGSAFEMSGFSGFAMHVKSDPYLPESEVTPTVTLVSGALRIAAPVEDIQHLLEGTYYYDIIGLVAGEPDTTIMLGTISVGQGITVI